MMMMMMMMMEEWVKWFTWSICAVSLCVCVIWLQEQFLLYICNTYLNARFTAISPYWIPRMKGDKESGNRAEHVCQIRQEERPGSDFLLRFMFSLAKKTDRTKLAVCSPSSNLSVYLYVRFSPFHPISWSHWVPNQTTFLNFLLLLRKTKTRNWGKLYRNHHHLMSRYRSTKLVFVQQKH